MKIKKFAAVFAAAAMLTACGNGNDEKLPDISETETVTETESVTAPESETVTETSEEAASETETETETEAVSETEQEAPEEKFTEEYKALYKEILSERMNEQNPDAFFDLFDIDSDGVPELILSDSYAHMEAAQIYTIADGKAVRLENSTAYDMAFENGGFGSYGEVYVSDKGYIYSYMSGTGTQINEYYLLKNGKVTKLLDAQHNDWVDEAPYEYGIDGKEVTEAEYNDAMAEFENIEWTTAGRKYTLDQSTIDSVLDDNAYSQNEADYRYAYKSKLLKMLDEYETASAFDLFDMNGDGIPELFVTGGEYHAAGVFAYTFKDGALVDLSDDDSAFGSYGEAAVSADGYLTGEYSGMGITYDYFYKLDGDKLVMISSTETGEIPDGDDYKNFKNYYKVNDKDATEEEYNSAFAEYDAHDWVTVGRGNLISEETINSVLFAE